MRFVDVLRVALGQLRVNPLRTLFTLLGMIVSVGFLVAVVAIIQGMNAYVTENISAAVMGVNTFQVRRAPLSFGLYDDEMMRLIQRRPRLSERDALAVRDALPDAMAVSMQSGWPAPLADVLWRERTIGSVQILGVSPEYQVTLDYRIAEGRPLDDVDVLERRPVVVIGAEIAEKLFETVSAVGNDIRIRGRHFTVVGVAAAKGQVLGQSFDGFALMPISSFEGMYGRRQTTTVSVKMRTSDEVQPAIQRAQEAMRIARRLRPGDANNFTIDTAEGLVAFWDQLTKVLFAVVPAIVAIGILVGGIVIMNIMMMAVQERTHEIGIRKAVGATSADVRRQFLAESVALAFTGGILGVLSGWLLAVLIATVSPLPARVTPWSIGLALALGAIVGILFGVYPAARAAELDPITAMRAET
ncbi:MAG: ABC transporter permease [Phycisphaerae bacterium]|nr:ABC transporter permease [Gemmatimonadaceae bacterium]